MSLIVTVWTNEGIVMGSDSRISFSSQLIPNLPLNIQTGHFFDTQEKTFSCPNNCGISTCGAASILGKNITGFIYNYINTQITTTTSVDDTATNLKAYIDSIDHNTEIHFIVAGYDIDSAGQPIQKVYFIKTGNKGSVNLISNNANTVGAHWDGEIDTLSRIMKQHFICASPIDVPNLSLTDQNGRQINIGNALVLPKNQTLSFNENIIAWNLMSLQDAIDFVRYAINTTIETMRFTNVNKTVGGPVDVLVIKPNKTQWIAHKKLH